MHADGRSDEQSVFNWPFRRVAEELIKLFENVNVILFRMLNVLGVGLHKRN